MSRFENSNAERPQNPAVKFLEWSGKHGHFTSYNPSTKEKEIIVPPLIMTVVDERITIKGGKKVVLDKKTRETKFNGVWSNEVESVKQKMVLLNSDGVVCEGTYAEIKGKSAELGGKYTRAIYAVVNGENVCVLINKSALSPFIDFLGKDSKKIYKDSIQIDCDLLVDGEVPYYPTIYTTVKTPKENEDMLKSYHDELKQYFKDYKEYEKSFNTEKEEEEAEAPTPTREIDNTIYNDGTNFEPKFQELPNGEFEDANDDDLPW